jgi:hypothetical protein
MALFQGAKDAIWLRNLLCEFGVCQGKQPTTIFHDNQGFITWVEDGRLRKVKHIDLRYKYTTSLILNGLIQIKYVASEIMKRIA